MATFSKFVGPIISFFVLMIFFLVPKNALAIDERELKLAKFLKSQNSPLVFFAHDFVSFADKYQIDYRLLVSISGTESTFGKFYIPGTFNAYGWGVGKIAFKSWPDGIEKISKALKENYINRGADDIYKIGRIYCPPTYEHWSTSTKSFMDKIENTKTEDFVFEGPESTKSLALTI